MAVQAEGPVTASVCMLVCRNGTAGSRSPTAAAAAVGASTLCIIPLSVMMAAAGAAGAAAALERICAVSS